MVQQVKPMNCILRQINESLKLKCQVRDCDEKLTVTNYKSHDGSCPKLFLVCPNCDFQTNLIDGVAKNNHECVQYRKDRLSVTEVERSSTEVKLTEAEAKLSSTGLKAQIKSLQVRKEEPEGGKF